MRHDFKHAASCNRAWKSNQSKKKTQHKDKEKELFHRCKEECVLRILRSVQSVIKSRNQHAAKYFVVLME